MIWRSSFAISFICPVALYLDGDISTFYWPGKAPHSIQRDYAAVLAVTAPQ
ncbi:MAG TPA: hypothetical protein VMD30_06935 [Tepidisphaeraceae bacterium]|nr:hypothetical protein [Tepidisphaeraceae bacterium]